MKKNLKLICLSAISAFILSSCGNGPLVTKTYEHSKDIPVIEGESNSPKMHIDFDVQYLDSENNNAEVAKNANELIVATIFDQKYHGLSLEEASKKLTEDLKKEYVDCGKSLVEDCPEDEKEEMLETPNFGFSSMNWEYIINGKFGERVKDMISYVSDTYMYTGGAHGGIHRAYIVIDAKTGKQIPEADFFVDDYKEPLSELLRKSLKETFVKENGEESYDALFVKDIEPNGNFFINENGIEYVYNQYEIACYADGVIYVPLTWEEIEPLLRK